MIRRPPRSTRTDTLFPYTTLCRSRLETVNQEDCFVQLEELKPGLRIDGLIPAEVITVIAAQWHGTDALELTYKNTAGALGQQVVFRSEEHTSELQSLMRISYAVFCLKKKTNKKQIEQKIKQQ